MEFVHDAMTSGVWIYLKNLTLYFLALRRWVVDLYRKDAGTEKSRSRIFAMSTLAINIFFKIVIRIHFYILVQCQYEQNIFVFFPSLNIAFKLIHY